MNLAYAKTRQVGSSGDGYAASRRIEPGRERCPLRIVPYASDAREIYQRAYIGQYVDLPLTVGGANVFGDGLNPVALAANTDRNFYNYTLLGDAFLEVTPVKNLTLKSDIGTNFIITDYKQFYPTWGIDRIQNSPNSLAQSNTNDFTYNWTNTANYRLLTGKHDLNLLAGTEIIYTM